MNDAPISQAPDGRDPASGPLARLLAEALCAGLRAVTGATRTGYARGARRSTTVDHSTPLAARSADLAPHVAARDPDLLLLAELDARWARWRARRAAGTPPEAARRHGAGRGRPAEGRGSGSAPARGAGRPAEARGEYS